MGLKVDMSEVHSLKEAINSDLNTTDSKVSTLSSSMSKLIGADGFEGEAASSIKNYTNTFHIKTISKIKTINEQFKKDIEKSIEKFESEVDNSKSAILVGSQIKEYKKNIDDALLDVNKAVHKAGVAISSVSDLTTAQKIDSANLSAKMATFNQHIDKTLEKLNDFDSINSIDGDRTDNLITELKGLNSYVKNLPSNRAIISSTSSKINDAKARHKTSEEIIRWQKYMEDTSDYIYSVPNISESTYETMKKAGQEYYVLKAVGDGSAVRGYKKIKNTKDVNKLINNLDRKRLVQVTTVMNTNRSNIKFKNVFKNANEFVKNNPFKDKNLVNWMSKVQGYDNESSKLLKQTLKDKNLMSDYGKPTKYFDVNEMKKAALTEFKNTFVSQDFRETFFKKDNLKSKSAIEKNIKKYWNEDILGKLKGGFKEFKNSNILGKIGKLAKLGGKALKPLAVIAALTDNLNEKSKQKQLVGMGVDFAAIGGSAVAGAAVGSAIPGVGTVIGGLIGAGSAMVMGMALDIKLPGSNKSVTGLAKDGINKGIDKIKNKGPKIWGGVTSNFKKAFS
ncbi:T7SS effector LXG polymorphic toxin [Mammaliicoccus sp. Dog046]|uniref:T7SS effector LXG polymorphic toxin n=1 Tax=Mammaliicoccus sp. Dog046 TaxID=3034233 RepID=UPI002B259E41|nr:T7SS effector LXG polymorphic toxin [Mammaliicoccus sp. Dog046]WQK85587.1 T7SS effector LXG polymorphic toxin [Mammaliicoccus sp. Dog046]